MQAAELGLEVNSPLGHAYLVPFKSECQLIIGYRGYIELAKRSGQIDTVEARCVYANDFFEVVYGTEQRLVHRPALKDPGPLVCVYALARIKGSDMPQIDVLTPRDIEYAKSISRTSASGPWRDRYDEMARKTAVRRLAKYLPLSPELADAMDLDDRDSELQVAPVEVEEPLADKLSKRAAATRKPETVTMQSAPATAAPESDATRFCKAIFAAQDMDELDRVWADAAATLKGADYDSAKRGYDDRRAQLGG